MSTIRSAGPALLLSLTVLTVSLVTGRPVAAQTPAPAIGFTSDAFGVEDNAGDTTSPGNSTGLAPQTS